VSNDKATRRTDTNQYARLAAVAELVPNKHRGTVQACLDLAILPWTLLGALIGGGIVTGGGTVGWRIVFIMGVALNLLALGMAYFWYHPVSYGPSMEIPLSNA